MWIQVKRFTYHLKKGEVCLNSYHTCIEPYRHGKHHIRNLLSETVIIVMNKLNIKQILKDKRKHVKREERGSHNALQKNHGQLVDKTMSSC